jgi:catechol 2,3-dioxygenase-like lactoylglutathione lyase family enzyme
MKNRTATLTLTAAQDEVFAFLANLENLPLWAVEYCRELRRDGAHWKIRTPNEDRFVTIVACAKTGVIDLLSGEHLDEMEALPLRVIRRPHGCAVSCTLFQSPEQSDELFEWRYAALLVELRTLAARFGGGAVQAPLGEGSPFYPGVVTAKFYETWDFYTTHLGFRTVCECDAYVQLRHPSGAQLGVMRHELPDQFPALVSAVEGRGFWLNLNVADADAEHARMVAADVEIVSPPEDKPWGERHFVVRDPNSVLISLGHRLPATQLAEAHYAGAF